MKRTKVVTTLVLLSTGMLFGLAGEDKSASSAAIQRAAGCCQLEGSCMATDSAKLCEALKGTFAETGFCHDGKCEPSAAGVVPKEVRSCAASLDLPRPPRLWFGRAPAQEPTPDQALPH